MENLEAILILLFAAILLVGGAQKLRIPYPIVLVFGGILVGFIPGLRPIAFNPDLILLIVLPPILYYAAYGISFREFKQNWRDIFSLALGLVVATTFIVGVIFKWMFPEFPWALAFAFGAIVSPPDAVSATTILKRFSIHSKLANLLEGESLVNDASALVLYKLAVTALLTGSFSLKEGGAEFIQMAFGGIFLGFILGFAFQFFSKRFLEPVLGVVFSFTIPYITYILANFIGVSGVLAVVVNGLIGARVLLSHHSSLRRILGYATWDIFIIPMNCFVFVLIGLQLRTITNVLSLHQMALYIGYALLITFAMIIVRAIWVFAKAGLSYLQTPKHPKSSQVFREAALVSWSGMRGIVSLAAALAIPLTTSNGMPIDGRNEVIFMTFAVILMTLVIPGFTLPSLIRWLKIDGASKHRNEKRVRDQLTKVAEDNLKTLYDKKNISEMEFNLLKGYFLAQARVQEMSHAEEDNLQNMEFVRLKVIHAQREELLLLWEQKHLDDKLLTHLEHELDMEEVHIARAEL